MAGSRQIDQRSHRLPRLLAMLAAAAAFSIVGTAWAHDDETSIKASEHVLQAIAYIVNSPGNMDAISDKLKDAQESSDTSGVDLALVRQAQAAVASNDMMKARDLLQRSIGAVADMTGRDVRPILQVPSKASSVTLATGEQTGTTVVTDEMPGRGSLTDSDVILLVLAAAAGVLGTGLSLRFRPAHSIHRLRRLAGSTRLG